MEILLYSLKKSERLEYVADYTFGQRLGLTYEITTDLTHIIDFKGIIINYSSENIKGALQICPEGILFEDFIRTEKPRVENHQNNTIVFGNRCNPLGFDVLSAIFYFVSRYEEYQLFKPDQHGRFPGSESLAYQQGFLLVPVVDIWILLLKKQLELQFGTLQFKAESYSVSPTLDIDNPWCYLHKGLKRQLGGMLRDLTAGKFRNIVYRINVLLHLKPDPHFTFEFIHEQHRKHGLKARYFILVGQYGQYDKTVSIKNSAFKTFVRKISNEFETGIHPSYKAHNHYNLLKTELDNYTQLTGKPALNSRQHYLKFTLPEYYRQLEMAGIQNDYSMGFADMPGFRAGTSRAFRFFDLSANQATNLIIHPFSVMERTLSDYLKLNPDESLDLIKKIVLICKKTNGNFVSLWHNESLSDYNEWKNWKQLYINTIEFAQSQQNS